MSIDPMTSLSAPEENHGRGDFKGTGGELLRLWLVNSILTTLTFGVYFAWAKARMYHFFYSNTEFAGARFRYTGNGKEIFVGTLKAVLLMVALFAIFGGLMAGTLFLKIPALTVAITVAIYGAMLFLGLYAIYSTVAYRVSRARYREISFHLQGDAWTFARAAFPYALLGIVTLGIAMPYYSHFKIRRIYNNLSFGSLDFAWNASAGAYWRLAMKGFLLSFLTFGVYYFFWLPKWFAFVRGHLSVGGCRFHGDLRPGELFRLTITNLLMMALTFGLATPWALVRSIRFFLARLTLENPSRLEAALQGSRQKVGALGEAVGDSMDMDVGLGF